MWIYVVLYILTVVFCFLETNIKIVSINKIHLKMADISFWVLSIYILILGVIRDGTKFTDGLNYMIYYWEPYGTGPFWKIFRANDPGYLLFNWLIGRFTSEFWVFEAVLFAITFISVAVWIRKHSKNVSLSFFIYLSLGFLHFELAILRNALAVSIFIWSYDFLVERKPFKFILTVLLAATCHQTALFMLVEYPLLISKSKSDRRLIQCAYIAGAVIMSLTVGGWVSLIYGKADYSLYLGEGGKRLLLYYIVLFVLLYFLMRRSNCGMEIETDYQLAVSTVYFQIISMAVSIGTRVLKYSTTYLFLLIPGIVDGRNRKTRNTIVLITICFLSVLFFVENFGEGAMPYVTRF